MARLLQAPEPTIWALRKNPRAANMDISPDEDHTLYEHLFGYDPISLRRPIDADAGSNSAANPKLNILNAETNFAVMELASELPEDETV